MKKILAFVIAITLCGHFSASGRGREAEENSQRGIISISGAWALYPLVVRWAEEYRKTHPGVKIDISAGGAGKGMADALAGVVDIGMVSREIYPEEIAKGAMGIPVAKDAVVATINEKSPAADHILKHGLKREDLIGLWITGDINNWSQISGAASRGRINVYTRSDACGAAETWAGYLGARQEDLGGVGIYGDPGLAEAVRRDILGVGFNNINFVYDAGTKEQISGIRVIPLDIDGSGTIESDEDNYDTLDAVVKAISEGRYPSPPARELYFVFSGKPENEIVRAFTEWALTEGQKYVAESGYIKLEHQALRGALERISEEHEQAQDI